MADLATFALAASFCTFLGLGASTVAIVRLYRDTRDVRIADIAATTAVAAVLFLIGAWLIIAGVQL